MASTAPGAQRVSAPDVAKQLKDQAERIIKDVGERINSMRTSHQQELAKKAEEHEEENQLLQQSLAYAQQWIPEVIAGNFDPRNGEWQQERTPVENQKGGRLPGRPC